MKKQIVLSGLAALLMTAACGGMEGDEALDQIEATTSELVYQQHADDTDPPDPGEPDLPPVCDPEDPAPTEPDEPWGPPTCPPPAPEPDCPQGPLGPCTDP